MEIKGSWLFFSLSIGLVFFSLEIGLRLMFRRKKSSTTSEGATTSTSSLDRGSRRDFEVFLNFRGPDSRHTVASVLHDTLTRAGVRVFLEDEGIRKGDVIEGELLEAITNSKIYIPIFSKDYASSKWCLRELAKMTECWKNSSGKTKKVILPVFYDVDAEDAKLRAQVYNRALKKHKKKMDEAVVKPWEDALKDVAEIKGWNLKDHGLVKLVDLITEEVFSNLNASGTIGIHDQIEAIMQLLDEGSPDVRFIVIHGPSGIGKTTLAKLVFKKISSHFQGSCILLDVRRSSTVDDMARLKEKLLSSTLNLKSGEVCDIDEGIRRLRNEKILIILDDVDKSNHLTNLAAKSDWFGPESRIIITTSNIGFLTAKNSEKYYFYQMKEMDCDHALQLFCRYAFEKDFPPYEFYDISTKIVATTGGLPLVVRVIGSLLFNQDDGTWKFRLQKLKEAHKNVQKMLMISYEALEYEQQQMFLDIACFFDGEKKMDPIYFWEACKFYPNSGIKILVRRSLIKVNDHDELWMHDQLRDLGRAIAQPKSRGLKGEILPKPSRIWSSELALDILRKKEVTESITALEPGTLNANCSFVREEFAGVVNLKFLQLRGGNFEGDFKNVFQQLKWLTWFNCPLKIEATNLNFRNLVVLKLSWSQITKEWGGWRPIMVAKQLKVLNLTHCTCLEKTPDFSAFLGLERLILKDCWRLKEIDRSIAKLKHLNYLKISNGGTQVLLDYIGSLESLTVLKINDSRLAKLHPSIGELKKLKRLCLRCPQLEILPNSIGKLMSLVELDISFSRIKTLPFSIGDLKQLSIFRMNYSAIGYLPYSIGKLESLNELDLSGTEITMLPETIGDLKKLKVIDMSFASVRKLPRTLGKMKNLEELYACNCTDMELPKEIGKLSSLTILNLSDTMVIEVPKTISQLSNLKELVLGVFYRLQEFPKLPTSLTSLEVSFLSLDLYKVPDLSNMTNLVSLKLTGGTSNKCIGNLQPCVQTPKMEWLARLTKMEKLTLVLSDLMLPSTDLGALSWLEMLDITCFDPQSLIRLPSSLRSLTLHDVTSSSEWQLFSGLNKLSTLELRSCMYTEIRVDGLGQLKNLHVHTLKLEDCKSVEGISNLSCLKKLRKLVIVNCPHLVDIQGLGELEFLRSLLMQSCRSIQQLPDLSSLKKVEELSFVLCESLKSIPDVHEETLCYLVVSSCRHFDNFRGPYRKLKPKALSKMHSHMKLKPKALYKMHGCVLGDTVL